LQNPSADPDIPCIRADLQAGALVATQHLLSLGHRRIAHIADLRHYAQRPNDRLLGYRAALREAGIGFDEALVMKGENSLTGGDRAMRVLMQISEPPPTAVFTFNDRMAAGALHALRDLGLRVPQDVAVVGFDGIALGAFTDPELTTIEHPREALGTLAAKTLLDLLEGIRPALTIQTLPVRLVVRQSCGARLASRSQNESATNKRRDRRGIHATDRA
jgi:DNA-binding LacI/PurR family transcriptional regulator